MSVSLIKRSHFLGIKWHTVGSTHGIASARRLDQSEQDTNHARNFQSGFADGPA